jgi:hypothetical protein
MTEETKDFNDFVADDDAQVSESDYENVGEDEDDFTDANDIEDLEDEDDNEGDHEGDLDALASELNRTLRVPTARAGGRYTTRTPTATPISGQPAVAPGLQAPTIPPRWKTTARPAAEARGTAVVLRKEDRHLLSKDQLVKLQGSTTGELSHQFEMMSGQTDDQLSDVYNLAVRVDALSWRLKKTDTIAGFDIFVRALDIRKIPSRMPRTLPLIGFIDDLSLNLVRATMKFKRYYGQEYDLQDLQWSQELLENSCDEALRAKIIEKAQPIPDDEMGGAVFYYIMMQLIRVDTEKAVRSLLDKVGSLSIAQTPGENVCHVVSLLQGVLTCLRSVRMVLFDFTITVIGIMETSTVTKFTSFFTQMRHTV